VVQDAGFMVQGSGFRVEDVGRVQGAACSSQEARFRDRGFRLKSLGLRI